VLKQKLITRLLNIFGCSKKGVWPVSSIIRKSAFGNIVYLCFTLLKGINGSREPAIPRMGVVIELISSKKTRENLELK